MKQKSEPPADKKLIKRLHNKWCRTNGYKPQAASAKLQAPPATSRKLQAQSLKLQASSATKKTQS